MKTRSSWVQDLLVGTKSAIWRLRASFGYEDMVEDFRIRNGGIASCSNPILNTKR